MEKEFLLLGNVVDTIGLDGTIKVFSTTNNQVIRYKKGNKILLEINGNIEEKTIENFRSKGQFDCLKLEGISTIEEAQQLKGALIKVYKDINDLKEGYYYYSDLQGCSIVDNNGKIYGNVIRVEEYPANINLRIKAQNGKEFLLPFIEEFIVKVDIESKSILINYMEGLL